jgi:hypothetical protein
MSSRNDPVAYRHDPGRVLCRECWPLEGVEPRPSKRWRLYAAELERLEGAT